MPSRELTEDEMAFDHPRELDNLDDVPEMFRGGYVERDGRYHLHPEVIAAVEQAQTETQEKLAALEAETADSEAKSERLEAQIIDVVGRSAIRNALIEARVPPAGINGATAMLMQSLKIITEQQPNGDIEVLAEDQFGRVSVSSAVAQWLESDDGAWFRPKLAPATGSGLFSDQLKALRSTLH